MLQRALIQLTSQPGVAFEIQGVLGKLMKGCVTKLYLRPQWLYGPFLPGQSESDFTVTLKPVEVKHDQKCAYFSPWVLN